MVDRYERPGSVTMLMAVGIFAALSLLVGAASEGFLEADGCTHYLYARFALRGSPHFFVNVWGRPIFTALYAIPSAYLGLVGAHVVSLVLAVACALIALRIARNQGYRWPVLALIFTLGQPLVFLHSFSELTELPFAALLGLAFVAYQSRHWFGFAVVAALMPLSRPEGFGFLILAAIALVAHRRWWWLAILPLALLAWNFAGWTLFGREGPWWRWLYDCWPYSGESLYKPGNPLHFVMLMPAVTSPLIFPATCVGVWKSLRSRDADAHRRRCQKLIAIIPLLVLVGHSVLYATGKLASSGEIRYMLVVAPFWGVLAAAGWVWIWTRLNWRAPLRWAGGAVLAAALANFVYGVVPLGAGDDLTRSTRFVQWYRESGADKLFPRVCAAQVTTYYVLDVSPADRERTLEFRRDVVRTPPAGTILVWDPIYSMYNADQNRSISIEELTRYGWRELADVPEIGGGWRIFRSP